MRHIVYIRAEASLLAIQSTIAHARAKRLALVFPFGAPAAVSAGSLLETLSDSCERTGANIAIIGGDAVLRAAAAAAGFPVATSLDEWETTTMPVVTGMLTPGRGNGTDGRWPAPKLVLLHQTDDDDALDHAFDDRPPEYVIELMANDGTYPGPHGDLAPSPETEVEDDAAAAERLRLAAEQYEEDLTAAIRRTGELPPRPAGDSSRLPLPEDADGHDSSSGAV